MNEGKIGIKHFLQGGVGANVINQNIDMAIAIWKNEVKNAGILKEIYSRKEYEKPSDRRKRIVDKAKYQRKFEEK